MWNFTTTNIINADHYKGDTPSFILNKKGENDATETSLIIKKGPKFLPDTIVSATLAHGYTPVKSTLTIDLSDLVDSSTSKGIAGLYRIKCYITDSGDVNPLFANSGKFKGRPFYIEAKVASTDTAAEIVAKFIKNGKLYMNNMMGEAFVELSTIDGASSKILLTAGTEYLGFKDVAVQVWNDANCLACDVDDVYSDIDLSVAPVIVAGRSGFGTYTQIMKDLRLPTDAHRQMYQIWEDEMPAAGVIYDEFVITMKTERPEARGMGAVGQLAQSITTHVFFVAHSVSDAFKSAIEALGVTVVPAKTQEDPNGDGHVDPDLPKEITVTPLEEGLGTLSVSKNSAVKGERVVATVTPASGKKVDSIVVTTTVGSKEIAKGTKSKLTFEMPDEAVTVSATVSDVA